MPRASVLAAVFGALGLVVICLPAYGGQFEDELRAEWVGSWVVLGVEVGSDCGGKFTNNRLVGGRTASTASFVFDRGELGRVTKVDLKRSRLDLFVELSEPFRVSWTEGPFELFEQRRCRVELEVEIPRAVLRAKDAAAVEDLLADSLERHANRSLARDSNAWNRRQVEALPIDYQATLAAYEEWLAVELERAVRERLAESLERAGRIVSRVGRSRAYGEGLAAGIGEFSSSRLATGDCERLVSESYYPARSRAPEDYEDSDRDDWRSGNRDGKELAFEIELARRLERCLGG